MQIQLQTSAQPVGNGGTPTPFGYFHKARRREIQPKSDLVFTIIEPKTKPPPKREEKEALAQSQQFPLESDPRLNGLAIRHAIRDLNRYFMDRRQARYRSSLSIRGQRVFDAALESSMQLLDWGFSGLQRLRRTFLVMVEAPNVLVRGPFEVTIDAVPSCNCPTNINVKGVHCIHIMYVLMFMLRIPTGASFLRQKAFLQRELAAMFCLAHPVFRQGLELNRAELLSTFPELSPDSDELSDRDSTDTDMERGFHGFAEGSRFSHLCLLCFRDSACEEQAAEPPSLKPATLTCNECQSEYHGLCYREWRRYHQFKHNSDNTCPLCDVFSKAGHIPECHVTPSSSQPPDSDPKNDNLQKVVIPKFIRLSSLREGHRNSTPQDTSDLDNKLGRTTNP